jgi:hypothetical protein
LLLAVLAALVAVQVLRRRDRDAADRQMIELARLQAGHLRASGLRDMR